jgi:hypothetical protein
MVRIPLKKYDQQVSLDTPRFQDAPSVPKVDLSGGLSGINKIGQANQQLAGTIGTIGETLAKHAIERQLDSDNAEVSARETIAIKKLQDLLYSKDIENRKIDGQDIEVPKGYMNRLGVQSNGSTIEFEESFNQLRQETLSGLRTKAQYESLNKSLEARGISSRGAVINHEGSQYRKNLADSHDALAKTIISGGSVIGDKDTLLSEVDKLDNLYTNIGKVFGQSKEVVEYNQKENASNLVENSVRNVLRSTGDLTKAQALLNDAKDKILPDKYIDLTKQLKEDKKTIDTLAKQQLNMQKDELYSKFFDGNLTLRDIDAFNKPIEQGGVGGRTAVDLKNKIIKAQNVEIKDITRDDSAAESYIQLIDDMVKDDITKFDLKAKMVDYYSDGIISGDEAKQMSNTKKILEDMRFNKTGGVFNNSIKTIKSWFGANNPDDKALATALKKFVSSGAADKNEAEQAAVVQAVVKQAQVDKNPKLGLLPDLPNQTIRDDGTLENNMPGMRNLPKDVSVSKGKSVIKRDPVTGVRARVYSDGSYEIIGQ